LSICLRCRDGYTNGMTEVTLLLEGVKSGEAQAANDLLPLIYDELKRIAALKIANESPGQTLQATALVHEAYLKLAKPGDDKRVWQNRQHFLAVAAEAMRLILIDKARQRKRVKHGSGQQVLSIFDQNCPVEIDLDLILDVDDGLMSLESVDMIAARIVKLRYYGGMEIQEIANLLEISRATVVRNLQFARAWLVDFLTSSGAESQFQE
jgi:RNA polymerase sigma factor (TIGR02999 family)